MFEFMKLTGYRSMVTRTALLLACLAGGYGSGAAANFTDSSSPENPYAIIAARNTFELKPPPAALPAHDNTPPPHIMPNGILTGFGPTQVLFKTTPSEAGPTPKEQAYRLTLGEQQDDITVENIDLKTLVITFNNHGITQQIPLTTAPIFTLPDVPPPVPGGSIRTMPKPTSGPLFTPAPIKYSS